MDYRLLMMTALTPTAAAAGTVHFETDTAAEVRHRGTTIARASGPGALLLGDFPDGAAALEIRPEGKPIQRFELSVNGDEPTTLRLHRGQLSANNQRLQLDELPSPNLGFRSADGEDFTVIVNGTDAHALSGTLMLDSLPPGRHRVEVRSADRLIVWARGTVDLMAGETVILGIASGRMVVADGLSSAWTPVLGDAR